MEPSSVISAATDGLLPWAALLAILCGAGLAAWAFDRSVYRFFVRQVQRSATKVDDIVVTSVRPALTCAVFIVATWIGIQLFPFSIPPEALRWIGRLAFMITVLIIAIVLARLIHKLVHAPATGRAAQWAHVGNLLGSVLTVVVYVLAFLVVLDNYGVKITPLLTSLGIATIAVALALQDTLSNYFSGLWIQTGRQLQNGDYIRLEDPKVEGFVKEVGWRATIIRSLTGNSIVIPKQTMAKTVITDFSRPETKMGFAFTIRTGFEADPDQVVPILLEEVRAAAAETPRILTDPAPAIRLNDIADNGWEFNVAYWIRTYWDQWEARGLLLNRIRKRFLREGIRIPYPMNEQYAVPPQRVDIVKGVAAAEYVMNGHKTRLVDREALKELAGGPEQVAGKTEPEREPS